MAIGSARDRHKRHMSPKSSARKFPNRWNLADLVKDPVNQFDSYAGDLETKVSRFESSRSRLGPTMASEEFRQQLSLGEEIAALSSRLGAYAYLWFSENTKNLQSRSFKTKVEERLTALSNRLLFFDLWWQGVDPDNARRLMTG
ncbi:MAG TPA: hypothetical protein VH681_11285, partial [Nitrospiraceae bacterium]